MSVFTLTSLCGCGTTSILGVFDSMEAVLERLRLMAADTDPGDEYRIECFPLRDYETELNQTESTLRSRAKWAERQARFDEMEDN